MESFLAKRERRLIACVGTPAHWRCRYRCAGLAPGQCLRRRSCSCALSATQVDCQSRVSYSFFVLRHAVFRATAWHGHTATVQIMGKAAGNGDGDLSRALPAQCFSRIAAIDATRCRSLSGERGSLHAPFAAFVGTIPSCIWHCTPCEESGLLGMTPPCRLSQPCQIQLCCRTTRLCFEAWYGCRQSV